MTRSGKDLKIQPGNPNANWVLSNVRKATDRQHIEKLEKMVQQEGRNPRALAFLNYGLGKELEDLEEWDQAFEAFDRGAKARRSVIKFDEQSEIAMYQAFDEVFTSALLEKDAAGHDDPSPIFVVGQPRTGTTLVERIITSHSQVHSAGELRQFNNCVRRLADYREPTRQSAELATLAVDIDCEKLDKSYLGTTTKLRGSLPRFVDKLPPSVIFQKIDAIDQTDISIGYRQDNWRVNAYVENVFNNLWYDGNYSDDVDSVIIFSQHTFGPSRPRTAGVRFSYRC